MKVNGRVCRLHVIIDGTKYEPGPIKASEAERLLVWTGYDSLQEWELRAADGDPLACRALLMLTEFRKGNHVKLADVDIEDVDAIDGDLKDELGRVLDIAKDDDGKAVTRKGQPVWLFDGEEDERPTGAATS